MHLLLKVIDFNLFHNNKGIICISILCLTQKQVNVEQISIDASLNNDNSWEHSNEVVLRGICMSLDNGFRVILVFELFYQYIPASCFNVQRWTVYNLHKFHVKIPSVKEKCFGIHCLDEELQKVC